MKQVDIGQRLQKYRSHGYRKVKVCCSTARNYREREQNRCRHIFTHIINRKKTDFRCLCNPSNMRSRLFLTMTAVFIIKFRVDPSRRN